MAHGTTYRTNSRKPVTMVTAMFPLEESLLLTFIVWIAVDAQYIFFSADVLGAPLNYYICILAI